MKESRVAIMAFLFLMLSYLIAIPDVQYDFILTDEDHLVENITALAFFIATVFFFITFVKSKGSGVGIGRFSTKRNLFFLALAFLFFVACGEEISWGQRIFGWSTPENLAAVNYQQETNIHNLDFFTFKNETDNALLSFFLVFNAGRIFFYFWFSFMIILPFLSTKTGFGERLVRRINIPVPPIWLGLLMIVTLVLSKLYKVIFTNMLQENHSDSIDEIMEANYALVIALMAFWFFSSYKHRTVSTSPAT